MTASKRPSFTQLVDWVEGRLSSEQSDQIEVMISEGDAELMSDLEWIHSFHDVSQLMPLEKPSEQARKSIRDAFQQRLEPWAPGDYLDADLAFDSRTYKTASGLRSGVAAETVHLAFENKLVHLTMDVVGAGGSKINVRGLIDWRIPTDGQRTEIFLTRARNVHRNTFASQGSHFSFDAISDDVDEMWLTRGGERVRTALSLEGIL